MIVAIGSGGTSTSGVIRSIDNGKNWLDVPSTAELPDIPLCVCYSGVNQPTPTVVIGGTGTNQISYSTDGITWHGCGSVVGTAGGEAVVDIEWSGSAFIAAHNTPEAGYVQLLRSTDGITWTKILASAVSGIDVDNPPTMHRVRWTKYSGNPMVYNAITVTGAGIGAMENVLYSLRSTDHGQTYVAYIWATGVPASPYVLVDGPVLSNPTRYLYSSASANNSALRLGYGSFNGTSGIVIGNTTSGTGPNGELKIVTTLTTTGTVPGSISDIRGGLINYDLAFITNYEWHSGCGGWLHIWGDFGFFDHDFTTETSLPNSTNKLYGVRVGGAYETSLMGSRSTQGLIPFTYQSSNVFPSGEGAVTSDLLTDIFYSVGSSSANLDGSYNAGGPPFMLTESVPVAIKNHSYTFQAEASTGFYTSNAYHPWPPFGWSLIEDTPSGLVIDPDTGLISGTVTAEAGVYDLTLSMYAGPYWCQRTVTLAVDGPQSLTGAFNTRRYVDVLDPVPGGAEPFRWTLATGTIPLGINLSENAASGTIYGTPNDTPGLYEFDILITDNNAVETIRYCAIDLQNPALIINTVALPECCENVSYAGVVQASGGSAPYSWEISPNIYDFGLTYATGYGLIHGTPNAGVNGEHTLTVTVTDSLGTITSKDIPFKFRKQPILVQEALPDAVADQPYSYTFSLEEPISTVSFSIAGDIPPEFSFNTETAELYGTATTPATYNFSVTALNDLVIGG